MPPHKIVLLAEDEAFIALAVAEMLEAAGYTVAVAGDGVIALEAIADMLQRGEALDALVTDLCMPRLGGEDLMRALRRLWPALPIVVVTGNPPAEGAEALRRATGGHGPLVLLEKPDGILGAADALAEMFEQAMMDEDRGDR